MRKSISVIVIVVMTMAMTVVATTNHAMATITIDESGTFLECLGIGAGSHELYSCSRIALYIAGECERTGQTEWPCDSAVKYIQNNGLQGERHLMEWEVAEDFRIVNEPETRDEKSAGQNLLEDLMKAYE